MIKKLIRKLVPKFILSFYHLSLAHLANLIYGHPSEKIIIIGVTGTNGKSTTANLISKILSAGGGSAFGREKAGYKTAVSSTVSIKIGDKEQLNPKKITMPGRFFLQKFLSEAVKNNCKFAIIESSSEGILQHRQIGIHYDAMVFTNLTPEHIEAHGSFENYKNAKLEYFRLLEKFPQKVIDRQTIPKIIVANSDDQYAKEFLDFKVDQKITFSKNEVQNFNANEQGIAFRYKNVDFKLNLKGNFDVHNALAAIAVVSAYGVDIQTAKIALEKTDSVPGRMELIDEGQNFKVLVDYAYEPEAMRQLYASLKNWRIGKIIHVLGGTGGGRDSARRPVLGKLATDNATTVILTTDDPYNDDPRKIMDEMAEGAPNALKILDRREAIAKALLLAQPNDLVLITGKGAEQTLAIKNGYIPWDDRKVVREELKKLNF